ncbi:MULTISPECIES: hypothetical protein [Haloferacaceae]|uniref:ABC transporter substrate-binding protein n=1 Tax=Halorubrum glutamatedens TaxID=2707018 RepID=A0ABD5QWG2_9EURY|nr:hypothetical protein [Halobellus captivus]
MRDDLDAERIDRRTILQGAASAGLIGLAGCSGDGNGNGGDGNDDDGTDDGSSGDATTTDSAA